jgi:hypothetical protein
VSNCRLQLPGDGIVSVAARPSEDATGNVRVEIDTILLCRKISANVFQQTVVDLGLKFNKVLCYDNVDNIPGHLR